MLDTQLHEDAITSPQIIASQALACPNVCFRNSSVATRCACTRSSKGVEKHDAVKLLQLRPDAEKRQPHHQPHQERTCVVSCGLSVQAFEVTKQSRKINTPA
eukprot:1467125-Amphidinium_carterae.1